jgi:hypothetical protein
MKATVRAVLSAGVALCLAGWVFGAEATVTGELVDVECYTKDPVKNVGVVHQDCATLCAMKGQALAIVTDKGEMYSITGDMTDGHNAMLAPHMSHRVVVSGEVSEKDGHKVINVTTLKMAGPRFSR